MVVTLYVDSSALLERYVEDRTGTAPTSSSRPMQGSSLNSIVEVRRNLLLQGPPLAEARRAFAREVDAFALVELDSQTCELAATVAEQTGVRAFDALHLGAALRVGGPAITFLSFDLRQAQAARSLGFTVLGS